MRRIGLIGCCFDVILLMTGCGSTKTLTCSMEEKTSYLTGAMGYQVTYKDDEVTMIEQRMSLEAGDEAQSYLDSMEEEYNREVRDLESDGIKFDLERKGNQLYFSTQYHINKMTDEELDDLGFSLNDDNSYETVKENLEEQGYTCK